MQFEEMVVAIIAIIGGIGFASFMFWNVFSLIKTWINRKSGTALNPQFFKALGEFKKDTERRLAHIEAIIAENSEEELAKKSVKPKTPQIEIEDENERGRGDDKSGNLRNMLNE